MGVCDLLDSAFGKAISFFERLEFLKAINIFKIEEDCVWLDLVGRHKLYGIKLEGTSNRELSFDNFEHFVKELKYSTDGEVFVSIVSRDLHKAVYVFSYSQKPLSIISSEFSIETMSGDDVISSIYDMYLATDYKITSDNRQISSELQEDFFTPPAIENINGKFKARIQNAAANILSKCTIYQATSFTGKETLSLPELFKGDWEGVFTVRFDFRTSVVNSVLKKHQSVAKFGDKEYAQICDSIINEDDKELSESIMKSVCVANAFLFLTDDTKHKISSISNELGINFSENILTGSSVMSKTLFLSRDMDFDSLVETSVAEKFFKTAKKKQVSKKNISFFWGRDICGDFVNYNFREVASSPHSIVIGRNGSGKSRQVIKMMELAIGLNKEKTKAERLGQIKLRYADVGYTSGRLLQAVKNAHPEQVMSSEANIDELRFSLFDIEVKHGRVLTEDLDYLVGIVNFALQTKNSPILDGIEEDFFRKIVTKLLVNNTYYNYPLSILQEKNGYKDLLRELLSKGYNLNTQFSELSDEYDFLKKPVLNDVLTAIGTEKNITEYGEMDRKILSELGTKLKTLSSYYFLEFHSNSKESKDYDFFHIDFDSLKETPASFCVIYWLIMKKWIKMLKESAKKRLAEYKEPIDTFFIIEEAHNFFDYPIFAKMLTTASKELRKYGGRLIFITQQLNDIPEAIAKEIGTKIFVAPPSEKALLKEDIIKVFKHLDKRDENVLQHTTDYMMFIMYDGGSIGCKFVYEGDVEWFYKPYAPSF